MSDPLDRARELEGAGDVDGAVEAYVEVGAANEAARVLATHGRLEDAGHAILRALGVEADGVGALPASGRKLAEQAAAFFKSYRPELAEQIKGALASAGPPPPEPASEPPATEAAPAKAPAAAPAPEASPSSPSPPKAGSGPPARLTAPASLRRPAATPNPSPAVTASGSFRAPVRPATESLRAPSGGGSFRPPRGGGLRKPAAPGGSFRPPERVSVSPTLASPLVSRPPARPAKAPPHTDDEKPAPGPRSEAPTTPGKVRSPSAALASTRSARPPSSAPSNASPSSAPARPARPVSRPPLTTRAPSSGGAASSTSERPAAPSASPKRPTPSPSGPRRPTPGPKRSAGGEAITDYSGSRAGGWRDADAATLERSIEELLAGGRKGAAARIARDAGQLDRALGWFQELGLHYQAGACLRELGRHEEALTELLGVDPGDPSYRKACFELIEVGAKLDRLDFDTDRFLTAFVDEGPADRDEVDGFLKLARLYSAAGFASSARRCALKAVGVAPDHEEALKLAGEARAKTAQRSAQPSRPRMSSVEGLPPLPSLDEFIDLAKKHAPA